jgi:hypothetical protein
MRIQEDKEKQKQMKLVQRQTELDSKRAQLGPEPSSDNKDTCTIVLRKPTGNGRL